MKIRKVPFTLIEMVISIGLTVIIMSSLSFFYWQVSTINRLMDKTQNEAFQKLYVENRFSQIIPHINSAKDTTTDSIFFMSNESRPPFKPGTPSLVFTFDNGVKLDKEMSYLVVGRLFLDDKNRLILAMWPAPKRWKENEPIPMTKEVLMENVETLSFSFYEAPLWSTEWNKEEKELPALLKIIIKRDKEELQYVFPVPNSKKFITYKS